MVLSCFVINPDISLRSYVCGPVCWFIQWLVCPPVSPSFREIVEYEQSSMEQDGNYPWAMTHTIYELWVSQVYHLAQKYRLTYMAYL